MTELTREPETDLLRKTYRELQAEGSDACPPGETLAALATGELAGAERDSAADHAVQCRRCSEDLQVLLATHAQAGEKVPAATGWWGRAAALGVAAVLVIFVARAVLAPRSPHPTEPSAERGPASAIGSLVVPGDGAELAGAPERFAWPAQKDADGYRVKLFDSSGEALWQSERVSKPDVGLPPFQRSRLKSGQAYFWNVEVDGPLEKTRLGPFRFRLSSS